MIRKTFNYFAFLAGSENIAQLKLKVERLKKVVSTLNNRIGNESVSENSDNDSDNSNIGPTYTTIANSRHYQRDGLFAKIHYFITNVSFQSKLVWLCE